MKITSFLLLAFILLIACQKDPKSGPNFSKVDFSEVEAAILDFEKAISHVRYIDCQGDTNNRADAVYFRLNLNEAQQLAVSIGCPGKNPFHPVDSLSTRDFPFISFSNDQLALLQSSLKRLHRYQIESGVYNLPCETYEYGFIDKNTFDPYSQSLDPTFYEQKFIIRLPEGQDNPCFVEKRYAELFSRGNLRVVSRGEWWN